MTSHLEKVIQETFGDLEHLSPEKIQSLLHEALKAFMALKEKSLSKDPKEREEAFKTAMSLKDVIQTQIEAIVKWSGVDPAAFHALAENPELFNANTWIELSSAKKDLEAFREQLLGKKR